MESGVARSNTIARDAPSVAAYMTPRVEGLANGLLRTVCISPPASPRQAPTITAIAANGSRTSQMMT